MYVIPPYSSTPRWMPSPGVQSSSGGTLSTVQASKQRMDNVSKRKRHSAAIEEQTEDGLPAYIDRYGYSLTDDGSAKGLDGLKRARVMATVRFESSTTIWPASSEKEVDMDSGSASSPSSAASSSPSLHHKVLPSLSPVASTHVPSAQDYFTHQYLRLSVDSPTGHPHPYASSPALAIDTTQKQGYFDAATS